MRLTIEIVLLVLATPTILLIGSAAQAAYRGYDSEYENPHRPKWKTVYNALIGVR